MSDGDAIAAGVIVIFMMFIFVGLVMVFIYVLAEDNENAQLDKMCQSAECGETTCTYTWTEACSFDNKDDYNYDGYCTVLKRDLLYYCYKVDREEI